MGWGWNAEAARKNAMGFIDIDPNSISINAIALRSGPIYPKSSIVSILNTGPKTMPIRISGRTSGSFVLSKSAVNKCAAKIINPTANTNVDIVSIIPLFLLF